MGQCCGPLVVGRPAPATEPVIGFGIVAEYRLIVTPESAADPVNVLRRNHFVPAGVMEQHRNLYLRCQLQIRGNTAPVKGHGPSTAWPAAAR